VRAPLRLRLLIAWLLLLSFVPAVLSVLEALGALQLELGLKACAYAACLVIASFGLLAYCRPPSLSLGDWRRAIALQLREDLFGPPPAVAPAPADTPDVAVAESEPSELPAPAAAPRSTGLS